MWHPSMADYTAATATGSWSSNCVCRVVTWLFAGMNREFMKQNGKCPDSKT